MIARLWLILLLALQPVLGLASAAPAPDVEPASCCPLCVCEGCACSAQAPDAPPAPSDEPLSLTRSAEIVAIRAEAPKPTLGARPEPRVRPAATTTTRRSQSGLAAARLLCVWRT